MKPARHTQAMRAAVTGLALMLVVAAGLTACGGGRSGPETEPPPPGEEPPTSAEGAPEQEPQQGRDQGQDQSPGSPLPRRNVRVYFPSREAEGLVGEWREIFATVTPGDRAKQIMADLISGPSGSDAARAVPQGTRLRQAFVMEDGVAYVDFSAELTDGMGGGSMAELLTVYAIVDSLVENVPEIRRVGILVNGRPIDSLNGHVDLRRPLPPDFSLVIGARAVRGDPDPNRRTIVAASLAAAVDASG